MELVPWRLGGSLGPFRKEMDRMWEEFFRGPALTKRLMEWSPSIDMSETKDNFVVKAELPGVDPKDVNVTISGDILTIKGEKKQEEEEKDEHHHYVERFYGSFQRSFQLPSNVKTDKINATYDKGVLKIMLPKTGEAKKKEIEIKVK